jgi:hypothetical protein
VFGLINKIGNAQKTKVVYYTREGKRTEYFKVPFKNQDGYYSCLFGEQLLNDNSKPIILVESKKNSSIGFYCVSPLYFACVCWYERVDE